MKNGQRRRGAWHPSHDDVRGAVLAVLAVLVCWGSGALLCTLAPRAALAVMLAALRLADDVVLLADAVGRLVLQLVPR